MGVDADLTSIIREIVQFLESLVDANLPSKFENARVSLLQKTKKKLSAISASRGSVSPEPYLDMNAGKGFLLFSRKKNRDSELEEYVGLEEKLEINSYQDYYETFQEVPSTEENIKETKDSERRKSSCRFETEEDQLEKKLCDIYKTFSTAKTISKAHKCGSLCQKVERKPFGFVRGSSRPCWIGLVGSHLLIYGSEDDKQAPEVCSIRGYSARPAVNSMSRDSERSKFVFEIFSPGNKTLQFIAKSTKEMDEWLDVINRTSVKQEKNVNPEVEIIKEKETVACISEEKYQDVGEVISTPKDEIKIQVALPSTPPPALPIRSPPRRLPSLPNEESLTIPSSYEPLDDGYEEDDIYHKIEDVRENGRSYENVKKTKYTKKFLRRRKRKRKEVVETETYDDVDNKIPTRRNEENGETYDDVRSVVSDSQTCENILDESKDQFFENYDDVGQISLKNDSEKGKNIDSKSTRKNSSEDKKVTDTKKTKIQKISTKVDKSPKKLEKSPTKSSPKRSFLDRVRHRKDSPKKEDKKRDKNSEEKTDKKEKNSLKSSENLSEIPKVMNIDLETYDDVSHIVPESTIPQRENSPKVSIIVNETSNYNSPPPPRPIYSKPPSPVPVLFKNKTDEQIEEIYDDIGHFCSSPQEETSVQEMLKNKNISQEDVDSSQSSSKFKKPENGLKVEKIYRTCARIPLIDNEEKNVVESEHYQIPRSDSVQVCPSIVQGEDQLYDDVAILNEVPVTEEDSSSPKKLSVSSIAAEIEKSSFSVKKPWSRFGSGKKIASRDYAQASSTKKSLEFDDIDNGFPVVEKQEMKLNKLQKLINKMENTLGKQPSKSVTPIFNKNQSND